MKNSAIAYFLSVLILTTISAQNLWGKTEVNENGEAEARRYFSKRDPQSNSSANSPAAKTSSSGPSTLAEDEHYLAIHIGSFVSSDSYQWGGTPHVGSVGRLNMGLTYRLGMFGSFADWAIRADFIGYELPEGKPVQLVVLPLLMFPEAGSKFPLYFGVGLGPGFFFNQIQQESFLSLNYQLLAGARFFNMIENTGFFIEGGLKNNILLLSDGQFMGYFLAVGAVFTF